MPAAKDAVTLLKADHRKVEGLFSQFERTADSATKREIVKQICTELMIHSMIEEEIFYPACKGEVDEDTVNKSYVEHDGAKVLIAELMGSDPDDDEFYDAKVKVLSEQIQHHVQEEEMPTDGVFAQAAEADLDLDELGEQLMERKQELTEEFGSGELPAPETRSFTGHELTQGTTTDSARIGL